MRLVLLGGGGFRTPLIVQAWADRRSTLPLEELVLQDVSMPRLQRIEAVLHDLLGSAMPPIRLEVDLDAALVGADVIFAAIRMGGAEGRVGDERRALDLGILGQETVGAGGLSYALRTLPVMLHIARRIRVLAPDAWLLNFTNPAGMITDAMVDVLGHKVIGLCDSPIGLARRACRTLGVETGAVDIDYVGINHLGWLRGLRDAAGTDLLPRVVGDAARLGAMEEGRLFGAPLIQELGSIPNEYLYFFYAQRDLVDELRSGTTRGEVIAADQDDFYADTASSDPANRWRETRQRREESYLAEARGEDERDAEDLTGGGYEHVALDLMEALTGGPPRTLIVNSPNFSAIPQLPASMIVEAPSRVDTSGAHVLEVPHPLSLHQLGLICAVRAAERTLVEAVVAGSRRRAELAFTLHPLVGSPRIAARLVAGTIADHPQLADVLH
ncbi:6-phospho-beta-glucosidase [Nakamurella sp. A5-74]|uniref:6-phospho-beta-glucosidase n=1 Tax=Nakamurella sp. A5-74 TaxID=3158264 RepID=A0AAU8DKH0_9ACTN